MENNVVVQETKSKAASVVLFFVCAFFVTGAGTAITYASGVTAGFGAFPSVGWITIPDWVFIAALPVLFLHIGISLFFVCHQNVYTKSGVAMRTWSIVLLALLFAITCALPFCLFADAMTVSYILACAQACVCLALIILCAKYSVGAMIFMIPFIILTAGMVYLSGVWAFIW